jgi:hypothetical protein
MMPGLGTPGQLRIANSPGRFLCQARSSHTPGIFWPGLLGVSNLFKQYVLWRKAQQTRYSESAGLIMMNELR